MVEMFVFLKITGVRKANFSMEVPSGPLLSPNTITEHNPTDNDLMSELFSDLICLRSLSLSNLIRTDLDNVSPFSEHIQ